MQAIKLSSRLIGLKFVGDDEPLMAVGSNELVAQRPALELTALKDDTEASSPISTDNRVIHDLLCQILESVKELEERRNQSMEELQQAAVEIALRASAKILRDSAEEFRLPLEQYIREAISRLRHVESVTLRLHPSDLAALNERLAATPQWREIVEQRRPQPDEHLSRGSVIVDAGDFGLMTSIEQQLMDIHQTLLEGISDAQIERRRAWGSHSSLRRFPDRREIA